MWKGRYRLVWLVWGVVAAGAIAWFAIDWTDEGTDDYAGGIVLRDSSGRVMRVSLGEGDVDCRPYYRADPDDWIVKALVAAEDGEFWNHCGVRPSSVVRAAFQNLVCRRRISGASTITMQAVRLIAPHPKTYAWKLIEAVKALKMERKKDKLWILSQYLNRAPYGANFVGIEAAAHGWFGKSAKDLGLSEAACLAAMVQAPSRLRPDRRMERLLKRREYVLNRMEKLGYITAEQKEGALGVTPETVRDKRPFDHPYYCDWFLASIGKDRAAQRVSGDFTTPMDADIQNFCERVVNEAAAAGGYDSAAIVTRVKDGAVVALACSGDYFDQTDGQVNTALAKRPAGSTLKPFLAALAFDRGFASPETKIADVPCVYRGYRPANFDNKYRGLVSIRDSLVMSLNIPFVRLLDRTGVEDFAEVLKKLGIAIPGEAEDYGLGMAIGNVEVSLLELTTAYAKLAKGGDGVFSEAAAYDVTDALSGDERSLAALGHIADVSTSRFAWKTGTSSAYRDAWTIAWNPEYAVGVWCGHKRGGFGDETLVGAKASAPLAWKIARRLYPREDGPWFAKPKEKLWRPELLEPRASVRSRLAIAKPGDGAQFLLVEGVKQQRIICQAIGAEPGERLWWFVDGALRGEGAAGETFVTEMEKGSHTITCVNTEGDSASVTVSVAD